MFIKLQPDQVILFWETIRHGMTMAYKIPEELRQDFAIGALVSLLSGMTQAWVGYEMDGDNRKLTGVLTTKIIDDKHHGVRHLHIDSLYGYRAISETMPAKALESLEKFAVANGCKAVTAEYSNRRVEEFLMSNGYEKHVTIARKIL